MPEKQHADHCDHDALLQQFFAQGTDRPINERAAIVSGNDANTFRQRGLDLLNLFLNTVNDLERVLPVPHDDDPADGLTLTVEFCDTLSQVRPQMYRADVLQIDRNTFFHLENDILQIADAFDVAASTHEKLGSGNFKGLAPNIRVAFSNRIHDIADGNVECDKFIGIEIDLILFDEPAHRRDFGHSVNGFERVPEVPVLERPKLGEVIFSAVIDQGVLENPPDTGGVRSDDRIETLRQSPSDRVQILDHSRARPVNVSAVLKDHVNKRFAEH